MLSMIDKRYSDFLPDGTRYVATLDDCYAQFMARNDLEMRRQTKLLANGVVETGNVTALKLYLKWTGLFDDDAREKDTDSIVEAIAKGQQTIKEIILGTAGSDAQPREHVSSDELEQMVNEHMGV